MLQTLFGIIAGFFGLLGYLPYIITTIRGKNIPNRATWWIWGTLGIIQGITYYCSGASNTIWLPILYAACQIIIAVLSIKFGEGGWNRFDRICLIGAGFSLILWWWYDSPTAALLFTLVIDSFGALPTVIKSYHNPETENCFSWTIFFIANTLNLFALENWSLELAAYPFYLFCLSLILATILNLSKIESRSFPYRLLSLRAKKNKSRKVIIQEK
jgi:uncharacterized protein with PQ loop repeat